MRNDIATPDRFLSVNDTIAMKAIAILFMLMHHLWAFPDRIAGGPLENILQFSNFPLTVHIGVFGKICVSIFFFLGGYGLYKKYFGKRYNLAERLKKLYFAYWKIFVIFVPIGFIFFWRFISKGNHSFYNYLTTLHIHIKSGNSFCT